MAEAKRRLAAILSADVAGYSRLMGADEDATIAALNACRAIFRDTIGRHRGRVVDTAGDSVLSIFDSVTDALRCAVAVQDALAARNADVPDDRRMRFRVGVNSGDIVEQDDGTVYGDGVNIAARLEGLAEPGGITVSGAVHDSLRGKLDVDFDDLGEQEVKNIAAPVRAYRVLSGAARETTDATAARALRPRRSELIAALAVIAFMVGGVVIWRLTEPPPTPPVEVNTTPQDPALALPTGPTIAVLPFDNLSGDPNQEYFVDGITEEIIAELTRFSDLFVVARNMTFQYKDRAVDIREVGRELGAQYIVKGSVRKDADAIRVTVQLVEVESGAHLWAETYDEDLSASSIFEVQDDITQQIVGAIGGKHGLLARSGEQRARGAKTENLAAHDCFMRALVYHHVHTEAQHAIARDCLERAVELDPTYADAMAELAYVYIEEYRHDYNQLPDSVGRAGKVARRALDLDPTNPAAHLAMALVHFTKGELEPFYIAAERAVALNPNDTAMLGFAAHFMGPTGKWDRALALMGKAIRLNPAHPPWYHWVFALDQYRRGEYEEALDRALRTGALGENVMNYFDLAAIYGQLGRSNDAQAVLDRLRKLRPGLTLRDATEEWGVKRHFEPAVLAGLLDGLRKAGLPEAPPEPTRPVIAVLPFTNMSDDPEQEYFSDGITEDILTKLTQFREFAIIAPNTTFAYRGDVEAAGDALGADYVLSGSVRRDAETIRLTARLVALPDGNHVWAQTYDRALDAVGIFALQDAISSEVARVIGDKYGVVVQSGIERLGPATKSIGSYECLLRMKFYVLNWTEPLYLIARKCLDRVTAEDSDYAEAWAARAELYVDGATLWAEPSADLDKALDFAKRAVGLAPGNQYAQWALAYAYLSNGDRERFVKTAEQAIALNPNNASIVGGLGAHIAASGQWERGIALLNDSIALNPNYPRWFNYALIANNVRMGDYEAALHWARDQVEHNPEGYWVQATMVLTLGLLDRPDEAKIYIERLRALNPDFEANAFSEVSQWFIDEEVITAYIDGWRRAGLNIPDEPATAD